MNKFTGWLFDIYAHPTKGVVFWLVGEDGMPYSFHQDFESVFYARGPAPRLHELGLFLRRKYPKEIVRLERVTKEDLFEGLQEVMGIRVSSQINEKKLFREVHENFSDLIFYDADIPLSVRFAVKHDVYMMARCEVVAEPDRRVISIHALDTQDELDPKLPNLRMLSLRPDTDPAHKNPAYLIAKFGKSHLRIPFAKPKELLSLVNSILSTFDPDVIQTHFGDSWLFPKLLELSKKTGILFNPNRDSTLPVLRRKEISFFNYGHAHYRAPQVHLRGRWHVDVENCMTYNQYQLIGAIEQVRLSSLPLQEVARRSPGAAMASMQNITAMKRGVLVPYQYQKGELPKTFSEFVRADRGGLVFQPPPGIFENVAILDFSSMMASIMIKWNVSPETVVPIATEGEGVEIRELGVKILSRPGLIPETLKSMRDKRLALKQRLRSLNKNDPNYRTLRARLKAIPDSLKWLIVVCYGRLGFANATFGRISAHEVVSYLARKETLKARSIAESHGFNVLHLYVDSISVSKAGATVENYQPLANEIEQQTKLPMDFDGIIYPWFAFLATRENPNISVANRFYGLSPDGEHKIRGIALRRGDTCKFVANLQMGVLEILAKETDPKNLICLMSEILSLVHERFDVLKRREIPLQELVVTQALSRELDQFSVLSPLACASKQLQMIGKTPKRGQLIRFIYIGPAPGVHAWSLPKQPDPRTIDVPRYKELAFRAVYEVLQPLGITEKVLKEWVFNKAGYVLPADLVSPDRRFVKQETPIFADVPYLRLTNF
jgi:DNA polymerase-2